MSLITNLSGRDGVAFSKKAREIYKEKYKKSLEKTHKGKYAAIHVDSGDLFLGETRTISYLKGIEKYPDAYFYFIRIGLPPLKKRGIRKIKK